MRTSQASASCASRWRAPSLVAWACVVAVCSWLNARPARSQATQAEQGFVLELRGGAQAGAACFRSEQLVARIARYSAHTANTAGLRVVLELTALDAARLRILRGGTLLARRYFERLPAACADRRDAVALAIALALEHVDTPSQPAEAAAEGGDGATGAATPAQSGRVVEPSATASASESAPAAVPQPTLATSTQDSQRTAATSAQPLPDASTPGRGPATSGAGEPGTRASEAAPQTTRDAPLIKDSLPSASSHSRAGEAGGESIRLHLGGRFIAEALPFPAWAGSIGAELPLSRWVALHVSGLVSLPGEAQLAGYLGPVPIL